MRNCGNRREEISVGFNHIDIVGQKVRLRPIRATDAEIAHRLVTNEAILSNLVWDGPADEEELYDTYRQWEAELKIRNGYELAIEQPDCPGLMGCIGIRFPGHPLQADIGYWLGEPFWGKGYMTDAIRLVCHLSFKYLNAVRVYAPVFAGNIGSRRALEKNGFSLDGTIRNHVNKRGKWLDVWFLTLLCTEWEDKRAAFCPRREDVIVTGNDE